MFYLVATGWMVAKRKDGESGNFEIFACIVPIGLTVSAVTLGLWAANGESGLSDVNPSEVYIFAALAAIFALSDIRAILRGGLWGAQRIARHLWRLCFALFTAAGSFFLGQEQLFPEFVRESYLNYIPVILVIVLMIYWMCRVSFTKLYKERELNKLHS